MLVEHAARLPEGAEWEYEYSWPGDRVLAAKTGVRVRLIGAVQRRDLTNRFPVISAAVAKLGVEAAVIDGVIRAIEPRQLAAFGSHEEAAGDSIRFIATDLLTLDAADERQLPWTTRRHDLAGLVAGTGLLLSFSLEMSAAEMLASAADLGADGVIAKRKDSRYRPYARLGDWVRVPLQLAAITAGETSGTSELPRHRFGGSASGQLSGDWRPATT